MVRLLLGHLIDVPSDPFASPDRGGEALRSLPGGAVAVRDGRIVDRGTEAEVRSRHAGAEVASAGGWIVPGFVDAHVHYPQLGVMGVLDMRLLDWLRQRTWPHEARFADPAFARDYLDVYDRHGLIGARSVLAHDVHPSERELGRLAETRAVVCHCAGSNQFIGSGLFPMRRHLDHGVRLALGTDVAGGPGFSLLGEARTAYQTQMLLAEEGVRLDAARLLWLVTMAGAEALGLDDEVGDLTVGKQADLVVVRPRPGGSLTERLRHAVSAEDALGALITLSGEADVAETWVAGRAVHRRDAAS